jgi:hypothetical protein
MMNRAAMSEPPGVDSGEWGLDGIADKRRHDDAGDDQNKSETYGSTRMMLPD